MQIPTQLINTGIENNPPQDEGLLRFIQHVNRWNGTGALPLFAFSMKWVISMTPLSSSLSKSHTNYDICALSQRQASESEISFWIMFFSLVPNIKIWK